MHAQLQVMENKNLYETLPARDTEGTTQSEMETHPKSLGAGTRNHRYRLQGLYPHRGGVKVRARRAAKAQRQAEKAADPMGFAFVAPQGWRHPRRGVKDDLRPSLIKPVMPSLVDDNIPLTANFPVRQQRHVPLEIQVTRGNDATFDSTMAIIKPVAMDGKK